MIVISYKMYKEYIKRKRANAMRECKESETRFIIEQKIMRDVRDKANWWDNFNVALYVKYLESK